jgi:HPt (histidine-containing phosphotransfer) domain-containing protein
MEMTDKLLDENIVAQFSSQQINTYFSLFLKNANALISSLATDLEANNMEGVRQRAHKLKGSSMVVGAIAMKNLSHEIEEAARDKKEVEAEKVQKLKDQFQQLADLLQQRYNLSFNRGA